MSRAEGIKRELKKSKGTGSFSLKNLFGSVNTTLRRFIQPCLKASELLFPSEQGLCDPEQPVICQIEALLSA